MTLAEKIKILDKLHGVIMAALVGHEYHVNESAIHAVLKVKCKC
jgi:nitrate reductase NapAB chaperone NapD